MSQRPRASRSRSRINRAVVLFSGAILFTFAVSSGALLRSRVMDDAAPRERAAVAPAIDGEAPRSMLASTMNANAALPAPMPTLAMLADASDPPVFSSSGLSLDVSADWTTAYYFRGIFQENHGSIFQPGVELSYAVNDTLTVYVGTWNSVHGAATASGTSDDFREHWYESDLYAGMRVSLDKWTLAATYIAYTSPSDAFDTIHELELAAGFDDSDCWNGKFALNPEARLAFELGSNAADGQDAGIYLQLGIAPSFNCTIAGTHELTIALPVTLGLSLGDYYQDADGDDNTFGFLDLGVDASYALPKSFIGGEWSVSAGVHALILSGATEALNNGDNSEVIARFGISASF